MTKSDFFQSVPPSIEHKEWGYAKLEIVSNNKDSKGVCYRHGDKTASCGTYGPTWFDVYIKLSEHLRKEGYMKRS